MTCFSIITIVWIDIDAWYHEWHCYEYCHIQFMLFWHELYVVIFFLALIDTWWWCSKWRIPPSYNSCHFNVNCIVMVTLIDTSVWYYELHCCEYYHIQLTLLWHELYFCWCHHLTTHFFFALIVWCGIRAFYVVLLFVFVVINCICICNGDVLHEWFNSYHAVI